MSIVVWRNWIVSGIERIHVYLHIVHGLFSFVNFSVTSLHLGETDTST